MRKSIFILSCGLAVSLALGASACGDSKSEETASTNSTPPTDTNTDANDDSQNNSEPQLPENCKECFEAVKTENCLAEWNDCEEDYRTDEQIENGCQSCPDVFDTCWESSCPGIVEMMHALCDYDAMNAFSDMKSCYLDACSASNCWMS